MGQTAADR